MQEQGNEFDFILGRIVKFFQSFSILSSTYIIVVMAIDRCIAIVTPLRAGEIRVSIFNDNIEFPNDFLRLGTISLWLCMAFSWPFIDSEYIHISFTY